MPEFVGYYTPDGPIGYIEAGDPERASVAAQKVTSEWPKTQMSEPIRRLTWKRKWRVKIWTD